MNDCTIVILGATGDLTRRKLLPALYQLIKQKKIEKYVIIGAAIEDKTVDYMLERAQPFIKGIDDDAWKNMRDHAFYQQCNFKNLEDFEQLKKFVEQKEHAFDLSGNRLVYLASAAHLFCEITHNIGKTKLVSKSRDNGYLDSGLWQRIVYEKPFGTSLDSAREINECIHHYFNEHQIYRIDHYLTKELVANITLLRFTNIFFEPLWNSKYIEYVQINLTETIGLEGRGRYYDYYGVLKDVVQNHVLQLLSLIAMEPPKKLTGDYIRDKKADVLKNVQTVDGILGQYDGYIEEDGVAENSKIPTFALLHLAVNTPRWKGVPFYIKSGKRLEKKDTSIRIKFREISCPVEMMQACPHNVLTIQIAPDASFALHINAKPVGVMDKVMPVKMEFCHSCLYGATTPASYETLVYSIMQGEQSVSVRSDEIEYAWKVIEGIEEMHLPLFSYEPGSEGPKEVEDFIKKYGIRLFL